MNKIIAVIYFLVLSDQALAQNIPYDSLVHELAVIIEDDQKYRLQQNEIIYGKDYDSTKALAISKIIHEKDSLNVIKVRAIIDKYGWLGPDKIGTDGNQALFLVIQHADIDVQLKYLEVLRLAVKNGNAKASTLGLLEDRIREAQGKLQIYGTQIGYHLITKEYFVFPLEDPEGVEKRRTAIGLRSYAEYLLRYKIVWNVDQYKKDLPGIQAMLRGKYPGF